MDAIALLGIDTIVLLGMDTIVLVLLGMDTIVLGMDIGSFSLAIDGLLDIL